MMSKVYNPVMKPIDEIGFRDWRRWATAKAKGRVLEIGAGTGLNFSHYDPSANVVAFDPEEDMLEEIENAEGARAHISLVQAEGEALPFPSNYFDSAVGTLVFCTIPKPKVALAELKRVLRPGARIRLVEHVRAKNPVLGVMMDVATPLWRRVAGGCHLNRNTYEAVRSAGFHIVFVEKRFRGLLIGIEAVK